MRNKLVCTMSSPVASFYSSIGSSDTDSIDLVDGTYVFTIFLSTTMIRTNSPVLPLSFKSLTITRIWVFYYQPQIQLVKVTIVPQ